MAAITGPCICKQLRETSPITMKRKKTHKTSAALCSSVPPSADSLVFSLRVPESTEGVPQGGVLVTTIPACTAINHAAAVTAEESD